jgi:hypothetical protein
MLIAACLAGGLVLAFQGRRLLTETHPISKSAAACKSIQKPIKIPIELAGNHIFFQGRVNGSKSLWFSLDSGASRSLISYRRAEELGLQFLDRSRAEGAGGYAEVARIKDVRLNLSGTDLCELDIMAVPLEPIEEYGGRVTDVILGYELFNSYVVELDYAAGLMTLYDPREHSYSGNGETIPIILLDNHPYVRATILEGERKVVEGEFVIDTGSGQPLILQHEFIREHEMLRPSKKTILSYARGIGGDFPLLVGRIEKFILGRMTCENLLTFFPPTTTGTFAARGKAGNIGGGFLRRFKVIFDYSRRIAIFEPNNQFQEPDEYDMSGTTLIAAGPDLSTIKVIRVLPNSPAFRAGIKTGDQILKIDSHLIADLGLSRTRKLFKREGQELILQLKRGQKTLHTKLKLQKLI